MNSDPGTVRKVVAELAASGFQALVFGGWAEELLGLRPAGPHSDIDLLLIDPDLDRLDEWLAGTDEVVAKRASHKRALEWDGTLVELFLTRRRLDGQVTVFGGVHTFVWPSDLLDHMAGGWLLLAQQRSLPTALHTRSCTDHIGDAAVDLRGRALVPPRHHCRDVGIRQCRIGSERSARDLSGERRSGRQVVGCDTQNPTTVGCPVLATGGLRSRVIHRSVELEFNRFEVASNELSNALSACADPGGVEISIGPHNPRSVCRPPEVSSVPDVSERWADTDRSAREQVLTAERELERWESLVDAVDVTHPYGEPHTTRGRSVILEDGSESVLEVSSWCTECRSSVERCVVRDRFVARIDAGDRFECRTWRNFAVALPRNGGPGALTSVLVCRMEDPGVGVESRRDEAADGAVM